MRKTARYTWPDYKTSREIAKELDKPQFWTKYRNSEESDCNIETECPILDNQEY